VWPELRFVLCATPKLFISSSKRVIEPPWIKFEGVHLVVGSIDNFRNMLFRINMAYGLTLLALSPRIKPIELWDIQKQHRGEVEMMLDIV
ncbi:MAG: hypothetical protein AAGJ35_01560, partial [Myxococcota bacterium]